ncbi:CACTA en-spm transposon protein [Cucumis melo var. makuwa]|uniref:CACTA en-spm transposon protein n=1 Tax=Cucumis melo var. makuwa TaxID=1194695 RepID=A0A5A7SWY9_CUCMM|nr:CACTA en-spm transposon protein [Cucumis melo var. makuwa]TYK30303.1 CACTA en-spm transposon protein [Cucumis melo var. makuwa]
MSTSRMILCAGLTLIPQSESMKDRLCLMSLMTSSTMWMNTCHIQAEQARMTNDSDEPRPMSSFPSSFDEIDAMFLEFAEALDNPTERLSSVADNSSTSPPSATLTPRRRVQSRLLVLERYVIANDRIPVTIALSMKKPISSHTVCFSQRFFVLDFNYQAMNGFVEHQMLITFKEFRDDCHKHFKKYSDLEKARANPPHLLVGRDEN